MKPRPPELLGIPISEIARICHVSLKTAGRWKAGTVCPPQSAMLLLRSDLGIFDPAWAGWKIRNGILTSPEGWEISVNDVLATPLVRHQLAAYRSENRMLKYELDRAQGAHLDEQPLPDSWDVEITYG